MEVEGGLQVWSGACDRPKARSDAGRRGHVGPAGDVIERSRAPAALLDGGNSRMRPRLRTIRAELCRIRDRDRTERVQNNRSSSTEVVKCGHVREDGRRRQRRSRRGLFT